MNPYDKNNVFAKIIRGEIPCNKVYEDEKVLAFHDISKAAPIHVLVVPKVSYVNFSDFLERASTIEVADFFRTVRNIAHSLKLADSGFRIITNNGSDASQTVPHFHVHIMGGRKLGGLLPDDKKVR